MLWCGTIRICAGSFTACHEQGLKNKESRSIEKINEGHETRDFRIEVLGVYGLGFRFRV